MEKGKLYKSRHNTIVLCTEETNNPEYFQGVVLSAEDPERIGEYYNSWDPEQFSEMGPDEKVTVKNF